MAKNKTTCPVTREEFTAHAKTLTIKVGDKEFTAAPRQFSTGSLGWNVNDKLIVEINGKAVTLQVGMNLTVVGSKDLPGGPAADGEQA